MKQISAGLQTHLENEVTSLCRCWAIERKDNVKLGFTDHDNDLVIDGTLFEKNAGMEASNVEERLGLNVDSTDITGAFQSERITEKDIEAGKYDNARVTTYIVNWSDPQQYFVDRILLVGEISREDGQFTFELRGISSLLDQTKGRHFVKSCQADLGDGACGVNLNSSSVGATATVSQTVSGSGNDFTVTGLASFSSNWFSGGHLTWTSGANSGSRIEVSHHSKQGSKASIQLWQAMSEPIEVGDTFNISAGCDKTFETCKFKFNNHLNFQGFPHMPGNGYAVRHAGNSDKLDGGPIIQ